MPVFIPFIIMVLLISAATWYFTRSPKGVNKMTSESYFLAGRNLSAFFIGFSIIMTNISTELLVGLNGAVYKYGMIFTVWESTAGLATIFGAFFLLPKYLKLQIYTIPELLEAMYDKATRTITSATLSLSFVFTILPVVLYTGAINIEAIFHFSELFNISKNASYLIIIVVVGIIGSIYAIFGGLKGVVYFDTFYGIILMIAGLSIPILALIDIGNGNMLKGFSTVHKAIPEKFNTIGGPNSQIPFFTLFTGMIVNQVYYWCMNQSLMQKLFAARNLKEAQKGIIFSGFIKVFIPLIVILPGILAYYFFREQYIDTPDIIYPLLVNKLMPVYLRGFFVAAILGAILCTFNSTLNSASTMISLDIFKNNNPGMSDNKIVRIGVIFSIILAILSIFLAPIFMYTASNGMHVILLEIDGIYLIPIANLVLLGFIFKNIPSVAAKVILIFGPLFYFLTNFIFKINIHYIHLWGIEFVMNSIILLVFAKFKPVSKEAFFALLKKEDDKTNEYNKSWKYLKINSVILIILVLIYYIYFADFSVL